MLCTSVRSSQSIRVWTWIHYFFCFRELHFDTLISFCTMKFDWYTRLGLANTVWRRNFRQVFFFSCNFLFYSFDSVYSCLKEWLNFRKKVFCSKKKHQKATKIMVMGALNFKETIDKCFSILNKASVYYTLFTYYITVICQIVYMFSFNQTLLNFEFYILS